MAFKMRRAVRGGCSRDLSLAAERVDGALSVEHITRVLHCEELSLSDEERTAWRGEQAGAFRHALTGLLDYLEYCSLGTRKLIIVPNTNNVLPEVTAIA